MSTNGLAWEALSRKLAMESKRRSLACSGASRPGDGSMSGSRSLTSGTISAMSPAPVPNLDRNC